MSEENENNILIIVASRLVRGECLTRLHGLCDLEQRVVSTRNVRDAIEHAESALSREASKIVRGHDMLTKKLRDAESEVAQLNEQVRVLAAEGANMRSIIDSITNLDNEPQYHEEGMGCGLEDRGITDRYEAMSHGWECAMERVYGEVIPSAEELDFPATDAILREVAAKAVEGLKNHPAIGLLALASELDKRAAAIRAGEVSDV